jgi:hypothetical protein
MRVYYCYYDAVSDDTCVRMRQNARVAGGGLLLAQSCTQARTQGEGEDDDCDDTENNEESTLRHSQNLALLGKRQDLLPMSCVFAFVIEG